MRVGSVCAIAFAAACAVPALGAFKCTDEKGRTHIGETPPEACANVVTYETGRSGAVIRKIEPANANAAAREIKEKSAETEKTAAEQKRRDTALLDSYSSEREIDSMRDRNVEILKTRLDASRSVLQKAEAREQQVQKMVDATKGNPPAPLAADLARLKAEHATAASSVARLEKDLETTQARFAADKKRWLELRAAK
jgi:hypothetical protein